MGNDAEEIFEMFKNTGAIIPDGPFIAEAQPPKEEISE